MTRIIVTIFLLSIFFVDPLWSLDMDEENRLREFYRQASYSSVDLMIRYNDFAAEFALLKEDRLDFMSLSTSDSIPWEQFAQIREANAEFVSYFNKEFANFDEDLKYRNYKKILIYGKYNFYEFKSIMGFLIIYGREFERNNDPVSALKTWLGVMNLMNSGLVVKGSEGYRLKFIVLEHLYPLLCEYFEKHTCTRTQLLKLKSYFNYFSTISFNLKRMYECERIFIVGKIMPAYIGDTDKPLRFNQKIEDHFTGIAQQQKFWVLKEVESFIKQFHRLADLPVEKKIRRFRKYDRLRAKNTNVNKYLYMQMPVMYKSIDGNTKLNILNQLVECLLFRDREAKWPDNGDVLKKEGFSVFSDPYVETEELKITGKDGLLVIYSVGKNNIDNIYKGDDVVCKIHIKK
jgi:hypothetical protein